MLLHFTPQTLPAPAIGVPAHRRTRWFHRPRSRSTERGEAPRVTGQAGLPARPPVAAPRRSCHAAKFRNDAEIARIIRHAPNLAHGGAAARSGRRTPSSANRNSLSGHDACLLRTQPEHHSGNILSRDIRRVGTHRSEIRRSSNGCRSYRIGAHAANRLLLCNRLHERDKCTLRRCIGRHPGGLPARQNRGRRKEDDRALRHPKQG